MKIGRNKLMLIIASTGSSHGAEGLDPSTTPRLSLLWLSPTILCLVTPTTRILCRSMASRLTQVWSGRWRCLVLLPCAPSWITIAILSSSAQGITVKSSPRRSEIYY